MELEINGKKAELGSNKIGISRKAIDLNNMSIRFVDITNRFTLPRTQVNNDIFNSAYIINSDNTGLDDNYKAKIIDQFVLFNGIGFITDVNRDEYNFQIKENSKQIFENLIQPLNNLSVDSYDFTFNGTSYATLNNYPDDIWTWPVVCMHINKVATNTRYTAGNDGLKFSRPMFNFAKLLELMFSEQGWTITYDKDIIDKIALSCNHERFYVTSYQKTITDNYTTDTNITGLDTNDFENGVTTASGSIAIGSTVTKFRLRGDVTADSQFKVIVTGTASLSGEVTKYEFIINSNTTEIDFTTGEFKLSGADTGNSITLDIEGTGSLDFTGVLFYSIIEEADLGNFSSNNLIGYRVKAYDNLPDKDQIDLFKEAMIITNSIIDPDSLNKTVNLTSLDALNRLKSVDWSEKIDGFSNDITNEYDLAKSNNLVYDNDITVDIELGKKVFNTNIDRLEDEQDFIKLPYSASYDVEINAHTTGSMEVYTDTIREDDVDTKKTLNPRIFFMLNDGEAYTIGRFLELDWNQLYDNYYANLLSCLLRPRVVKIFADLNKLDVLGFDFTNLVYDKRTNSYYFVLDINDFSPGIKTSVTLLKFK